MSKEFSDGEMLNKHGVIFAIINLKGEILLEERSNDSESQFFGYTIVPSGGIEEDENVEEALFREVWEEREVTPTEYRKTGVVEEMKESGAIVLRHVFLITNFDGVGVNREGKNRQFWTTIEEADELCEHPISKKILTSIKESLSEEGK